MSKTTKLRRRILATIQIEADDWGEFRGALRTLAYSISRYGHLNNSVSSGYGFGYRVTVNEDETITHESWIDALILDLDTAKEPTA